MKGLRGCEGVVRGLRGCEGAGGAGRGLRRQGGVGDRGEGAVRPLVQGEAGGGPFGRVWDREGLGGDRGGCGAGRDRGEAMGQRGSVGDREGGSGVLLARGGGVPPPQPGVTGCNDKGFGIEDGGQGSHEAHTATSPIPSSPSRASPSGPGWAGGSRGLWGMMRARPQLPHSATWHGVHCFGAHCLPVRSLCRVLALSGGPLILVSAWGSRSINPLFWCHRC